MAKLKTLFEFEVAAEALLKEKEVWRCIKFGDKQIMAECRNAFEQFWLEPDVLTAQEIPITKTTLLGSPVRIPIGVAPTTSQAIIAPPDGDLLTAKATAEAGVPMVYSSLSCLDIEQFGKQLPADGIFWAQTYLYRDKRNTLHIVRNAEKYGFKALVVTVDSPVDFQGKIGGTDIPNTTDDTTDYSPNLIYLNGKEREKRRYSDLELWNPGCPAHWDMFSAATWEDLHWLKSQTKLPIVLKGILTAKAARKAVSAGVDGIIVSAHGGRVSQSIPPTLLALPEVVEAVKGSNIEVYMDSGIRTGIDVLKALALGARAVFIGRPILWGLAVKGKDGIRRVLQILEDEFTTAMTLCGCSSLQDIDTSLVKYKSYCPRCNNGVTI